MGEVAQGIPSVVARLPHAQGTPLGQSLLCRPYLETLRLFQIQGLWELACEAILEGGTVVEHETGEVWKPSLGSRDPDPRPIGLNFPPHHPILVPKGDGIKH